MYNAKVFLSGAALAGIALAQVPTPTGLSPACAASLSSFTSIPTPAPALVSYIATVVGTGPVTAPGQTTALPELTLEDPIGYQELFCSLAGELPKSLLPDFRDYADGLISYGSVHLSEYNAYVTDCITTGEAASTLISQLSEMLVGTGAACHSAPMTTPAGASNGTYPTGTGSIPSPTSSSTMIPVAAAARPTGAVVGAAVIGGLLGAVAML
ncbi:hypothetical protein F5Y19DRAFT_424658 [Xylariaceae sp. FL1651]|nr:hypothetical protein F5Y19DRAFT_424658 [Xylariaceae sp. FL1651]